MRVKLINKIILVRMGMIKLIDLNYYIGWIYFILVLIKLGLVYLVIC